MKVLSVKKVAAAVVIKEGRVLLACRKEGDPMAGYWEFPGGKIKEGESAEKCLEREFVEEFSMKIKVGDFIGRSSYHYPHGKIELLAYWAIPLSEPKLLLDHQALDWVKPGKLLHFQLAPADIPIAGEVQRAFSKNG